MRLALLPFLVPAICFAQVQGQPRLSLCEQDYDFGKIGPVQIVTHRFKASNQGSAPLEISRLEPSCGCTSTVVGQQTLAPGESTELEVSFNPAGQRGIVRKTVQVLSNDSAAPSQVLSFQAEVLPGILPPTEEVLFTDLVLKDRRKASVKLASETGQPILLSTVDLSEAPWLGVTTREVDNDLWVDFDLLARRLPASKLSGVDTITLHVANPAPATVKLNVRWERRSPVIAIPERVAWAEPAGRELRADMVLKDRLNRPFRVLSVRTSNPLLRVDGVPPRAAVRQGLQLVLSAEAKPGAYQETAFLTLDTPGHPELEIRVAASLH